MRPPVYLEGSLVQTLLLLPGPQLFSHVGGCHCGQEQVLGHGQALAASQYEELVCAPGPHAVRYHLRGRARLQMRAHAAPSMGSCVGCPSCLIYHHEHAHDMLALQNAGSNRVGNQASFAYSHCVRLAAQ